MVAATPLTTIISASLTVTIACILALSIRLANDNFNRNNQGSHDLLSKDPSVSTPISASFPSSSSSFSPPAVSTFEVPSNQDYYSAATSLSYIFAGYNILGASSTISTLLQQLNATESNGIPSLPKIVNVSRSVSSKIDLVLTSYRSDKISDPSNYLRRSIGLDGAPVLVLITSVSTSKCGWAVVLGYDDVRGFSLLDPTLTGTNLTTGVMTMNSPKWISQTEFLGNVWKCSTLNMDQLCVSFILK